MNAVAMEKKDDISIQNSGSIKNITISMFSADKKTINRVAKEFYEFAAEHDSRRELPIIPKVKEACLTTRKSPCGNGTATFSRYKLRVYERIFKLAVYDSGISSIIEFLKNSPVDVQFKAE